MPLHGVWEYRDIGRLFITVGGERVIIGVLRWGWVEVILRVSLEVILHIISCDTVFIHDVERPGLWLCRRRLSARSGIHGTGD